MLLPLCASLGLVGCDNAEPIVSYTVPTEVPDPLKAEKDRMLAAMVPKDDQVWFFKVTGPVSDVDQLEPQLKAFVASVQFQDGKPVLDDLPDDWRLGREAPMRFATIDVDLPGKQLNISVSQLGRQDDWDEQVKMNVNRWRGQMGLQSSESKWAEGQSFEVAAADGTSIWVDLTGETGAGGGAMASMNAPFASQSPQVPPMASPPPTSTPPTAPAPTAAEPDPRLKFERPEGWRDGRMSSMRMAAFNVGPESDAAELTVIPAGGDLRGNVARWLGQVRSGTVPDEVVDQALEDATQVTVDGKAGQRFLLTAEDAEQGTAIDATIVPLDDGVSLFIKMTGPAQTVTDQEDEIAAFLESLKLNL